MTTFRCLRDRNYYWCCCIDSHPAWVRLASESFGAVQNASRGETTRRPVLSGWTMSKCRAAERELRAVAIRIASAGDEKEAVRCLEI